MSEVFVNKVAESGLITIDLADYLPREEYAVFDLKDHLFMGLILKEKEFREGLKSVDLEQYRNKWVAITCSADAIVPMWANMLVASQLQPVAREIIFGTEKELINHVISAKIGAIDGLQFQDQRIVVKGCGDQPIPESAYVAITNKLRPFAKSIMYGEPCSTVPIYKKPKS
jgi:hypothetical protein